jgi:glycosyltransferase involved in cell wall biosynthesis
MAHADERSSRLLILLPVYSDWEPLSMLIGMLDEQLSSHRLRASLVVVDDGSPERPGNLTGDALRSIDSIHLLTLRRNLGHPRAIAAGLSYIHDHLPCDAVVVMDADGEDAPADVPRLFEKCREENFQKIIFAKRVKRSEGIPFAAFYAIFKALYRVMTGTNMRVGNFSIIPFDLLRRLVVVSEIWNHYAGGLMKARLPVAMVETARAKRLAGRSQMNFVGLVVHGMSAIALNGDLLGVRMLIATSILVLAAVVTITFAVVIRLTTHVAFPHWAAYAVVLSLILITQAVGLSLFFIFLILGARSHLDTIPQRDYLYFVLSADSIDVHSR